MKKPSQQTTERDRYRADRVRGNDANLRDNSGDARWWREVIERVEDFEIRFILKRK